MVKWTASTFPDVRLTFGSDYIKVNRSAVSENCSYFLELFNANLTQDSFEIKNVEKEDFDVYIKYLNNKAKFSLDKERFLSLMNVQKEIDIPILEILSLQWIENNMLEEEFIECYLHTQYEKLKVYRKQVILKIISNISKIIKSSSLFELSYEHLVELFPNATIKEISNQNLFELFYSWTLFRFEERKCKWLSLINLLDIKRLSHNFVIGTVLKNPIVLEATDVFEFLTTKTGQHLLNEYIGNVNEKVLLFGGTPAFDKVVCFDPATLKMTQETVTIKERRCHASNKIGNTVLVYGGDNKGGILDDMEILNLETMETFDTSCKMLIPRKWFGSACVNEKIYAIGGKIKGYSDLASVERYDPEKNEWYQDAPIPVASCGFNGLAQDQVIYLTPGSETKHLMRFDPRENHWDRLTQFIVPRFYSTFVSNSEEIYICGGYSDKIHTRVSVYDIRANSLRVAKDMPVGVCLAHGTLHQNKIFVLGGSNNVNFSLVDTQATWCYDIKKDEWSELESSLPFEMSSYSITHI